MKYDFTTILDRKGHDAIAYDAIDNGGQRWGFEPLAPKGGYSFIPMWVADMCFATAPSIIKAMEERLKYPTFGYFETPETYYNAIINWQKEKNDIKDLTRREIGYENGVHGIICSAIEVFSKPGEGILLNSPYYVAFKTDIDQKGRKCVLSSLYQDENGVWRLDYEDMDKKIKENNIHLVIFCSPHNPTGRVWTRDELEKAMTVFEKNNCVVISDEIWSDIVFTGYKHIPTQSVSEWAKNNVIAAYAPSKTFNLAGLIGSYHIIYNRDLRHKIKDYSRALCYNSMNVMSLHSLLGAYTKEGMDWLDELNTVLEDNAKYAVNFIKENLTGVSTTMSEGTYMLFLDCSEYCKDSGRTIDDVIKAGWEVGVGWEDGRFFGGDCHIRLNLALPRELEEEAFKRMHEFVFV